MIPSELLMAYEGRHFLFCSWFCRLAEVQPLLTGLNLARLDQAHLQVPSWTQISFTCLHSKTQANGTTAPWASSCGDEWKLKKAGRNLPCLLTPEAWCEVTSAHILVAKVIIWCLANVFHPWASSLWIW